MIETWKAVVGWPSYEVSNIGTIRRAVACATRKAGGIIKPSLRNGYHFVCLCREGSVTKASVHRIVAAAFIGDPTGFEVNHIDGCRVNNAASNLELTSRSQNALHAHRTGLQVCVGKRNGQAKLNEERVADLRRRFEGKRGQMSALAREFGVSEATVRDAITGRRWQHVQGLTTVSEAT